MKPGGGGAAGSPLAGVAVAVAMSAGCSEQAPPDANVARVDARRQAPRDRAPDRPPAIEDEMRPTAGAIAEAKKRPNGWVYQIEGDYGPNDRVPPEAIAGAWKVDAEGKIVGDFVRNPNFKPSAAEK